MPVNNLKTKDFLGEVNQVTAFFRKIDARKALTGLSTNRENSSARTIVNIETKSPKVVQLRNEKDPKLSNFAKSRTTGKCKI